MKRLFASALALGALALLASIWLGHTPAAQAQVPPTRFFGAATIDGEPVPVGTEVKAYINGNECGLALTTVEGRYVVDVAHDATRAGCGVDDAEVTFAVGGLIVEGVATFDTGAFVAFDLNASSSAPLAPPTQNAPQPPIEPQPPAEEPPPPAEEPPVEEPPVEEPPVEEPPPGEETPAE